MIKGSKEGKEKMLRDGGEIGKTVMEIEKRWVNKFKNWGKKITFREKWEIEVEEGQSGAER